MKLQVSDRAQAWYVEEMGVSPDRGIYFFGKVYGSSPIHDNYSLGVGVAEPKDPLVLVQGKDTVFFIEKADEWFFNGYDFFVDYNPELDEPVYHYQPSEGSSAPAPKADVTSGPSVKADTTSGASQY
ncbi:HesB/YadR/YfhF family protein [Eremococcus coleocola]|uniref:HesB/YadR/YfhF family protein n=1 Tax=Eremococcus coleocola TaxID=88132 RepID=UPI000422304D|nr:hypothetical protein [Eremococcus coleocola]